MSEKLKTLPETEYLQSCAAHYASRLEKAKSIGVAPGSEFYPAFLEVKLRAETLAECVSYVWNLPGVLATKEIVLDVTRYIISFFQRHPSPEETDADYSRALELVGDTIGEFRKFCACMDVFSNYAPASWEQEYADLVRYITSGIRLWLTVRSNIENAKPGINKKANFSAVESISGLLAGKLPDDNDAKSIRKERLNSRVLDDQDSY